MNRKWCLAIAMLAWSASPACAAENIACMKEATSAQDGLRGQFVSGYVFGGMAIPDDLAQAVAEQAHACAQSNGWSEDAEMQAQLYKRAIITNEAVEAKAPFKPAQWKTLRAAYAKADKAVFRRLVMPMIDAKLQGSDRDQIQQDALDAMTKSDEKYFENFLRRTGIPLTGKNSEIIGQWIGTQGMLDIFASRFDAS